MHSADIQAALKKQGVTQAQIAQELGVKGMSISDVIHKKIISDRIMKKVAERIGMDHRQVFPEYYLKPAKRSTSKVAAV